MGGKGRGWVRSIWDGIGRVGMGWVGLGWDGMGYENMRRDTLPRQGMQGNAILISTQLF